jgi:hypothetical protein
MDKLKRRKQDKRYYIEYLSPCGWAVMLQPDIIHVNSLRKVYKVIKGWNMYTQRHKHCSFLRFLWLTYRGYTSIHCLFKIRQCYKYLLDREILAIYEKQNLKAGFMEKL